VQFMMLPDFVLCMYAQQEGVINSFISFTCRNMIYVYSVQMATAAHAIAVISRLTNMRDS
jgi:hypothetical protein